MAISELNAVSQPHSSFFSLMEYLSGQLLFVGTALLMVTIRKGVFMLLALSLVAIIGLLTIFDAAHPVDCNRYQNKACISMVMQGEVSLVHQKHNAESTISGVVTILLTLLLIAWALTRRLAGEEVAIAEVVLVSMLALALIASVTIRNDNIVFDSLAQRAFNTLASGAFLYVAYKVWLLSKTKTLP